MEWVSLLFSGSSAVVCLRLYHQHSWMELFTWSDLLSRAAHQCPALMCAWPAQSAPPVVITPRPPLYPYNLPPNTSDNSENLGALELYFSGCGDISTVTLVSHGSPGLVGWAGVPLSLTALACHLLSCRQT